MTKKTPQHTHADFGTLSPNERKVVEYVCRGYTDKETGEALNLARSTVNAHRCRAMLKMRCPNIVSLTLMAVCAGIIKPCEE